MAQRLSASGAVESLDLCNTYGQRLAGNPNGDPFGFGGQAGYYTDSETGLCLLGQRYYDPLQGRFLTRDPLGYGGGMNLYAYCGDDPINFMDPSGMDDGDSILPQGDDMSSDFIGSHEVLGGYQQAGLDAASALMRATPLVGTYLDAASACAGCDPISGRPQSGPQRVQDGVNAVLSLMFIDIPEGGIEETEVSGASSSCFIAGTPVQMADGKTEAIPHP